MNGQISERTGRRIRGLLLACLALLLAGCVARPEPTAMDRALARLSFKVPEKRGAPEKQAPAKAGTGEGTARSQLYFGHQPKPSIPAGTPVQRTAEGVQLNLQDADIAEAAKIILGDILGVPFTVDPAIEGTVTVATTRPLPERDLLNLFETILRMHGAALADLGGSFAVLPADKALGLTEVVPLGGQPPRLRPGYGVAVVPLRYLSASTAANLVQPLLERPDDLRVDTGRNLLILTASSVERQHILETLLALDVDWMAGRSVGLFPLHRATPEAIIPELRAVLLPTDTPETEATLRFLPITRLNAVLAIATDPELLVRAETWVKRLDRGNTVGVQFYVYELKYVPAEEMAKLLTAALGSLESLEKSGSVVQAAAAPAEGAASPPEAPPAAAEAIAAASPETAPAVAGEVRPSVLRTVKIVPDKTTNSLLIRATPRTYDMIEATLRRLDRPPLQVLIEATIVEVLLTDQLRYGVQYFLDTANIRGGFNTTGSAGTVPKTGLEPLALLPGFNFIYTGANANITIQALSKITKLRVLSSPSIVVENNREAVLNVGDDVPIVTRTAVSVTDPAAPIVNNVEYRSTGVILTVRPQINAEDSVSLQIAQEVSRLSSTSVQLANQNPIIQQRKIASRVSVRSGQTVVLGGLIQNSETRNREKVPLLGDVPVLGELFSSTNNEGVRTELLVFLTPRVIRNPEDARAVSEELRSRMRAFAPPRRPAREGVRPQPLREEPAPAAAGGLLPAAIREGDPAAPIY